MDDRAVRQRAGARRARVRGRPQRDQPGRLQRPERGRRPAVPEVRGRLRQVTRGPVHLQPEEGQGDAEGRRLPERRQLRHGDPGRRADVRAHGSTAAERDEAGRASPPRSTASRAASSSRTSTSTSRAKPSSASRSRTGPRSGATSRATTPTAASSRRPSATCDPRSRRSSVRPRRRLDPKVSGPPMQQASGSDHEARASRCRSCSRTPWSRTRRRVSAAVEGAHRHVPVGPRGRLHQEVAYAQAGGAVGRLHRPAAARTHPAAAADLVRRLRARSASIPGDPAVTLAGGAKADPRRDRAHPPPAPPRRAVHQAVLPVARARADR